MSFYIAPYRYFSYIGIIIGVFLIYKTLSFLFISCPDCSVLTIDTLIIGVFLYIEETLFFLLYFAPEMCIFYIQCFLYSKNNTFLSIHFFCILPRLQCMFFLYIYGNQTFSQKNMCFTIYIQKKYAFFLYILSRYILYMCIFPIYIGVFILYINHFFFFSFPPAHSISVYRENNAFIYSTVQIMVFSLYIGKYCPFFSYISCHSISLQVFFYIYKH